MTDNMPHQIISRALNATVFVSVIRDPGEGTSEYSVAYESGAVRWLSRHRFQTVEQAEAGCLTLSDFLGAEYRA